MQITKKRLKEIISEEMKKLDETFDNMTGGLGLVLDFKQIIDKHNVPMEQAMQALRAAYNPNAMEESEKRNK